ncbi:MAG: hypothetical protein AB2795_21060 [Candidatus Thiodiazotropha endolucinida]
MFYTKQDFATAAIDAVDAFNQGKVTEAIAAHRRMDEMLMKEYNRQISKLPPIPEVFRKQAW